MSSQGNQRLRSSRNGSPSTKQGPIRATQQFGLASPSRGQVRHSPASSPGPSKDNTRPRARPLSETGLLTGRRSPSSPRLVEKPKPVICGRSNSFDNVMAAPYLSGQWPKDGQWQAPKDVNSYNPQTSSSVNLGAFTHDKQTQTPDEWDEGGDRRRSKLSKARSQSVGGGDQQLKNIKHKLQRNGGGGVGHSTLSGSSYQQRLSPVLPLTGACVPTLSSPASSMPIKIPHTTSSSSTFTAPRGTPGKARGSVEGLNQEVEKLIISGRNQDITEVMVPVEDMDGHRAPVFELLSQTRSVDTQTPNHGISAPDIFSDQLPIMLEVNELVNRSDSQGSDDHSACSSRGVESEERSQSVSPSFIPGQFELEDTVPLEQNDEAEDIKLSSSPRPNSEFMRQPPDGAEKIKIIDEFSRSRPVMPLKFTEVQHLVPSYKFQPSATSAFQSIQTKF